MGGWVYILASAPYGTLYVGVTADLPRRAFEHREGIGSEFTKRYGVHRLVYAEWFENIQTAIHREKRLKKWNRRWKIDLIEREQFRQSEVRFPPFCDSGEFLPGGRAPLLHRASMRARSQRPSPTPSIGCP